MIRGWLPALALTAAVALAGAGPAPGASRTITLEGWSPRALAFSGDHLIWTEAAIVRVDPRRVAGSPPGASRFDYYRAETSRAGLTARSTRFAGRPETLVSVRTSIGAMVPGVLVPTGRGSFLTAPAARRFAPPVVHCCDADGVETVLESDGRPDAPVTVAAAAGGGVAWTVRIDGSGLQSMRRIDLADGTATDVPLAPAVTTPGRVALSPSAHVWVDPSAPATLQVRAMSAAAPVALALPGEAARVWAAAGVGVVAARRGGRVLLLRVDLGPSPRAVRIWSGRRLPRVALGGRSVAVADGRRVLAARRGTLRTVTRGRRMVDAVGVSGRRVAWVERGRRAGARVGVVRLGRIR